MMLCAYCDEFPASAPTGTCDHCEPMPDAPPDERGGEPEGEARQTTLYRITERSTGRIYVGVHATDDPYDTYMGSGPAICAAVAEARARNAVEVEFRKDVLLILGSGPAALEVERGLVGPEQVASGRYFNLCVGGGGVLGLSEEAERRRGVKVSETRKARFRDDPDFKARHDARNRAPARRAAVRTALLGRPKSEQAKAQLSETRKAKFRDDPEFKAKHDAATCTPESRKKRSETLKLYLAIPENAARRAEKNREQAKDPKWQEANTKKNRELAKDPAWLEANAKANRELNKDPEVRAQHSASKKRMWAEMTTEQRAARVAASEEGKRRAKAERERVRREVALIFLALVAARAA